MEDMIVWHKQNAKGPDLTVDELLKDLIGMKVGSFTFLIEDGGQEHHGNVGMAVFNSAGVLVDDRIWFSPAPGQSVPKKSFIGTPIVDGTRPNTYTPLNKKAPPFKPSI
jgi:hypothetical protein